MICGSVQVFHQQISTPTQTPTQPSIYKSIRRELLNSLLLESLVTRLDTNTSSFRNVDVFTSLYRISWLFSMGSMREHVYIKEAVYIPFINILKMNVYRSLVWETIELFGNNGCYEDVQMKGLNSFPLVPQFKYCHNLCNPTAG